MIAGVSVMHRVVRKIDKLTSINICRLQVVPNMLPVHATVFGEIIIVRLALV